MERRKWIATVSSIWIQCVSGSSYAFGIYSGMLKSSQRYDQSTLDTVSVFKDIGANVGVLSGLLYSVASSRPWVVLLAGVIQCFAGYFFLWAAVTALIPRPPVAVVCFSMFLAAHAQTFFNTSNVITGVSNFPGYAGTIVGIMKGFLGLSGPILIQIYRAFCNEKPGTFLLLLALLPSIVVLSLMFFVTCPKGSSSFARDKHNLDLVSATAMVVAAYLMMIIITENLFTVHRWAYASALSILFVLLSFPVWIAVTAERIPANSMLPLLDESKNEEEEEGVNVNLQQAMCTLNFWLLFLAMACGMGSGLATINNVGQIGESLNYSSLEISTLVSLWGIWNFLGRFGAGYVSDVLIRRGGIPRPLLMATTLVAMSAGHLLIASGFSGKLYVGSVLIGVCYGSQWSLMPTITYELFGVKNMGTIFNAVASASPIGSYILSVRVVGYFYDREVNGGKCTGSSCFAFSFLILATVCVLGFLTALALYMRTKKFYRRIVIRRLRRHP